MKENENRTISLSLKSNGFNSEEWIKTLIQKGYVFIGTCPQTLIKEYHDSWIMPVGTVTELVILNPIVYSKDSRSLDDIIYYAKKEMDLKHVSSKAIELFCLICDSITQEEVDKFAIKSISTSCTFRDNDGDSGVLGVNFKEKTIGYYVPDRRHFNSSKLKFMDNNFLIFKN